MSAVTATAEQKALYISLKPLAKYPRAQLGRYLDAANSARLQLAAKPTDSLAALTIILPSPGLWKSSKMRT